jgi:hypothetical protein
VTFALTITLLVSVVGLVSGVVVVVRTKDSAEGFRLGLPRTYAITLVAGLVICAVNRGLSAALALLAIGAGGALLLWFTLRFGLRE